MQKEIEFGTILNAGESLKVLSRYEMCELAHLIEATIRSFGEPEEGVFVVYGQTKGVHDLTEQFATFVHTKNPHTQSGVVASTKETDVMRSCMKNGQEILDRVQEKLAKQKKVERCGIFGEKNIPRYMILDTDDGPLFAMFSMSGNVDWALQEMYCTTLAMALIYLRPHDKTLAKVYTDIMSGGWGALICLKQINDILRVRLAERIDEH